MALTVDYKEGVLKDIRENQEVAREYYREECGFPKDEEGIREMKKLLICWLAVACFSAIGQVSTSPLVLTDIAYSVSNDCEQ